MPRISCIPAIAGAAGPRLVQGSVRDSATGRREPRHAGRILQSILDSGLTLRRVDEPGEDDYPILFSYVAER